MIRIAALIALASLAGCAAHSNDIATMHYPEQLGFNSLERKDYQVLGDANARACATSICLWPIPIWFVTSESGTQMFGTPWGRAEDDAYYDAVESVPNADAIMLPRSKHESHDYVWSRTDCYTIRGKAIAVIRDSGSSAPVAAPASATVPMQQPAPSSGRSDTVVPLVTPGK